MRLHGKQKIQSVPGSGTRPTTARVREAVFNIWQFEMAYCRWLDLCAGTGAMGAEALCRGASLVVGVEQSSRACTVIRHNWQRLAQPHQQIQVLQTDVLQGIAKLAGTPFDRIYFDPPYASDLYETVLVAIATANLLSPSGVLAVEHHKTKGLPPLVADQLRLTQTRSYGTVGLTFYQPVLPSSWHPR